MRKRDLDTLYRMLEDYEEKAVNRIALSELSRTSLPLGVAAFIGAGKRGDPAKQRIVRVESYPWEG